LAPFDLRLNPAGLTGAIGAESLRRWRTTDAWHRRAERLRQLRGEIPDLRCDDHHLFGTPQFLRSTSRMLTEPSKNSGVDVVRAYIDANRDLFEINSKELDQGRLTRDFVTHAGLMRHLTWQQTHDGLDLVGCELRANLTQRNEIINLASDIIPRPEGGFVVGPARLSASDAIRIAAANAGVELVTLPRSQGEPAGANRSQTWVCGPEIRADEPVVTHLVLLPMSREDIRIAWAVVVPVPGIGNTYDTIVDAQSGEVLRRYNRLVHDTTEPVTYRVYPLDGPAPGSPGTPTPSGEQLPFILRSMITVDPDDIRAYSPDGWIPDGGSTTTGNNTDTYLDADGNQNAPDTNGRPVAADRVFDSTINVDADNRPTDAPGAYAHAAVTHAFYHTNKYHDVLYRLGFDENARNFQSDNFGRGGLGGDAVRMEVQDGSGTNNANWNGTAQDGTTGRSQMYIFTGPTPDRDGSLDTEIIYHELSHGLSIRLHAGGLNGTQAWSMGEGWGDFFGIAINAEPADDFDGVYSTGAHTTLQFWPGYTTNYYFGIRRFPYCTDLLKNPQTYADIDPGQQAYPTEVPRNTNVFNAADEVHNAGEVWCVTLIECRASMGQDIGFEANDVIMQLATDGMKLAPNTPTFLQERDAILQADLVRFGGAHQRRLWQAFAKRGMGSSATSPSGGGTAGIVESFDTPERVIFTYPQGIPARFDPDQPNTFRVDTAPFFLELTPDTGRLHYSVGGAPFVETPMEYLGAGQYLATVPGFGCFDTVRYYVEVGTTSGDFVDPPEAPAAAFATQVYTSTLQPASDSMETESGWTVENIPGPGGVFDGAWERADPEGTSAQPNDDHTPDPGTLCWITEAAAGVGVTSGDVDAGTTVLTTSRYDLSAGGDFAIEYWRWFSTGSGTIYNDAWLVEITNDDGATWHTFEQVAQSSPVQPGWVRVSRNLSNLGLEPTSQVRLRFLAADLGVPSVVEAAVDDLQIFRYLCEPGPACDPDVNCDGSPDQGDVACMILAVAGDIACICQDPDFNRDGSADQGDVAAIIGVVAGQPCP